MDISQRLPDSGASSHMTGNIDLYDQFSAYNQFDVVLVGNGKQLPVANIGRVTIYTSSGSDVLNDILHVPQVQQNLLSISQFTSDFDCVFHFDSKGFTVTDTLEECFYLGKGLRTSIQ